MFFKAAQPGGHWPGAQVGPTGRESRVPACNRLSHSGLLCSGFQRSQQFYSSRTLHSTHCMNATDYLSDHLPWNSCIHVWGLVTSHVFNFSVLTVELTSQRVCRSYWSVRRVCWKDTGPSQRNLNPTLLSSLSLFLSAKAVATCKIHRRSYLA